MKTLTLAAAAACFAMPTTGFAQSANGAPAAGGPPPAVISQMNLGRAGLLGSMYSGREYGLAQSRGGEDATRIAFANGPGPATGYKHQATGVITSFTARKMLAGGSSYLTFGVGTNYKGEAANLTEFDTSLPSFSLGYQNFANPNAAFAVQLIKANRETTNGVVTSSRDTVELRLDYAHKLNDAWGFTTRAHYSTGDLIVESPGGTSTNAQTVMYTQAELVGTFGSDAAGFVPKGWVFHPALGVSFDRNTVKTPGGNVVNDSGSVWAKGTLVKPAPPGNWSPNISFGIEHVYQADAGTQFIDEDTYASFGVGLSRMDAKGNNLNLLLDTRQGLKGNRSNTSFIMSYTFNL